jgi:hypothetical protein
MLSDSALPFPGQAVFQLSELFLGLFVMPDVIPSSAGVKSGVPFRKQRFFVDGF